MQKHLLIAFCLVLVVSISAAQQQVGENIGDHLLIKIADKGLHGGPENEVEGSPYLNDTFIPGDVYSYNKKHLGLPMRYDIYNDYMEFQQNNQTYVLDPEPRIKSVRLDNKKYVVVMNYVLKGKPKIGFMELLDSGKVILLAKKMVSYKEWQPAKALESSSTPARFTRTDDIYFYKKNSGEVIRIENLKKLIEGLADKKEDLVQFSQQQKINPKKEEDLKKFFQYYNSL